MLSRIAIPHTCFIDSQALLFLFFYMIRNGGIQVPLVKSRDLVPLLCVTPRSGYAVTSGVVVMLWVYLVYRQHLPFILFSTGFAHPTQSGSRLP